MTDLIHAWLELEHTLLKAGRAVEVAFAFAAVNLTHGLLPYRQAALWSARDGVVALSGAATVEGGSPYVMWLDKICRHAATATPVRLDATTVPAALAEQWAD